jgi:hypothetical protein
MPWALAAGEPKAEQARLRKSLRSGISEANEQGHQTLLEQTNTMSAQCHHPTEEGGVEVGQNGIRPKFKSDRIDP